MLPFIDFFADGLMYVVLPAFAGNEHHTRCSQQFLFFTHQLAYKPLSPSLLQYLL